ncbi:MAG: GNAT family N-acetyltransferase [Paludibacter sp.]|nr:GNAT family N-acetyltransferase [Paludibacter sp.]
MILLNKKEYHKAKDALINLNFNHLFANSVIDQKVDGKIYVDETENPTTFLFHHPYGMSILIGNEDNENFNAAFIKYALNINRTRNRTEWLQVFPATWNEKLSALFGDKLIAEKENTGTEKEEKIERSTRINFAFNAEKYTIFKNSFDFKPYQIIQTDKRIFKELNGTVVPKYFWNNADDFVENAIGFSLIYKDQFTSTAFAAFIIENKLELGIESVAEFRGNGFALYTCSALIDYCLGNGFEPVWACRLENVNSLKTAQKLGFEPTLYLPFYKLVTNS